MTVKPLATPGKITG